MPTEFWKDWDKLLRDNNRGPSDTVEEIYPIEWRKAIRSVIIRLFRAGIICPSYSGSSAAVCTAGTELNRRADLYFDFRAGMPPAQNVPHLFDSTFLDRDFLIKKVQAFQQSHDVGKLAILRLWSASHFYPIMVGIDIRFLCAFLDDRGRYLEFKFIPKDMPYSEWNIHKSLSKRLEPWEDLFGDQVLVAKDLILVMGKDEKDLRCLAGAVKFAVQTMPWRFEVDFCRTFVNVTGAFLEGLDR